MEWTDIIMLLLVAAAFSRGIYNLVMGIQNVKKAKKD
eukprot:SAG11_NODE_5887_length_1440_cov_2.960477_1_plen_37_part_00